MKMSANIDSDSRQKGRFVKIAKIASLVSLFSHSRPQANNYSPINTSVSTTDLNLQQHKKFSPKESWKRVIKGSATLPKNQSFFPKLPEEERNMPEAPALTITIPNGREEKLKGSFRWLRGVSQRRKRKLQLQGTPPPPPLKLLETVTFDDNDDDYGFLSKGSNNDNGNHCMNNNNNNHCNNNNHLKPFVSCSNRLCTPHPYLKPAQSTMALNDKMKRASIYSTLSLESIDSHLSVLGDSTHGDENNSALVTPLVKSPTSQRPFQFPTPSCLSPPTMYPRSKAKSDTHLYYCLTESPFDLCQTVTETPKSVNKQSSQQQIFFGDNFDIDNCQCSDNNSDSNNVSPAMRGEAMPPTPIKRNTNRRTSLYARFLSAKKTSAKQNSSATLRSTRFRNRCQAKNGVCCEPSEHVNREHCQRVNSPIRRNSRRMSDGAVLIRNSSHASKRRMSCGSQYNHDENGVISNNDLSSTDQPPRPESRSSSSHKSLMKTIRKRLSFSKQRSKSVERQSASKNSVSLPSDGHGLASVMSGNGSSRRDPLTEDRARSVPPGSREPSIVPETIINGKKQATSIMSLASNASYVHDASTLVVECIVNGETKHYVVKDDKTYRKLAKRNRKTKLTKLHLFADHVFSAVHAASSHRCDVCHKTFPLRLGKQAYKCRDCAFLTHKPCHVLVDRPCSANGASKLNFDFLEPIPGARQDAGNNGTSSGYNGRAPSPLPQVRVFTPPPDDLDTMIHYDEKRLV